MSGDHAEDQVNIGEQAGEAQLGNVTLGDAITLARAMNLVQQGPRKTSNLPPPGSVGPVMQGRYIPNLSLDPGNVKHIEGYVDHEGYVSHVTEAFSICHVGLKALSDAREQVKKDPSKTEAQQILMTAQAAEKLQERCARAMDSSRKRLMDGIKTLDDSLSKPLTTAADNSLSREVREHVKELSTEKRMEFMSDAFKKNDVKTLQAVLGAMPYLSGLTDEMQAQFTRSLHEKQQPVIAARLKTMRKALDLVESRGPLVFGEIEKALGARFDVVQRLRNLQSAGEQALFLINNPVQQS